MPIFVVPYSNIAFAESGGEQPIDHCAGHLEAMKSNDVTVQDIWRLTDGQTPEPDISSLMRKLPVFSRKHFALPYGTISGFASKTRPKVLMPLLSKKKNRIVPGGLVVDISASSELEPYSVIRAIQFHSDVSKMPDFYVFEKTNQGWTRSSDATKCLKCHVDGKLLWPSMSIDPMWPAIFGSVKYGREVQKIENDAFRELLEQPETAKQLSFLPELRNHTAFEDAGVPGDYKKAPLFNLNFEVENDLAYLNSARWGAALVKKPNFKKIRLALLILLSGSYTVDKEVRGINWWLRPRFSDAEIEQIRKQAQQDTKLYAKSKNAIYERHLRLDGVGSVDDGFKLAYAAENLTALRMIFSRLGDLELLSKFSMTLRPDQFDWPNGLAEQLKNIILNDLLKDYPDLVAKGWNYELTPGELYPLIAKPKRSLNSERLIDLMHEFESREGLNSF